MVNTTQPVCPYVAKIHSSGWQRATGVESISASNGWTRCTSFSIPFLTSFTFNVSGEMPLFIYLCDIKFIYCFRRTKLSTYHLVLVLQTACARRRRPPDCLHFIKFYRHIYFCCCAEGWDCFCIDLRSFCCSHFKWKGSHNFCVAVVWFACHHLW